MPKLQLTKSAINKLDFTPSGQVDYWDTELSGFGLRVGKESKTFMVKADIKVPVTDSSKKPYKTVKEMIGRYGVWTPEQARVEAADRIKISPTLVRGITSSRNRDMVRDIIHSAQSRNLLAVAEGVESLEQLAVLRELKCHLAQGFYFTRPASANDTERLLARSPRW